MRYSESYDDERRPGHVQRVVGAEREVKRRDARRQRRERRRACPSRSTRKIVPGSIADEQRAVGRERQAAGDAEIGRERLGRSVGGHAVDRAFEPARHVEPARRDRTPSTSG